MFLLTADTDQSVNLPIVSINGRQPKYCKIWDYYSHAGEVSVLLGYELYMQCIDPEDDFIVIFWNVQNFLLIDKTSYSRRPEYSTPILV